MLALLTLFAASIFVRGVHGKPLAAVAVTVIGVLYTGASIGFGYSLRHHSLVGTRMAGTALVLLPLLLTWASDTGAYFVGRAVGRRKLIPSVSPGKTVEGALGGLVLTVLICWAYTRGVLEPRAQVSMPLWAIVLFGAAISVAAQFGDLFESLLKREAGVKDSSGFIPGHGGFLDRFDSLFFVLPVAYLLLNRLLIYAPR
jgi:phosphatidate cytidylyltransferase